MFEKGLAYRIRARRGRRRKLLVALALVLDMITREGEEGKGGRSDVD